MTAFLALILIGIIIFLIGFIFKVIFYMADEKREEEQRQLREERETRERKEMERRIIEFGIKNGVDFKSLYDRRKKAANSMMRAALFTPVQTAPPTYTRGVVEGSIADNISILANAQKKAAYEEQQNKISSYSSSFVVSKVDYDEITKEIVRLLETLPNSEEYVAYVKKMDLHILNDESVNSTRNLTNDFRLGQTVTHAQYGEGKIIIISNVDVIVKFNNGERQTFELDKAKEELRNIG